MQEDNLISQMKIANKKLVFNGDDTWMKLFPGHFARTDGTTSFFVTDYTEVQKKTVYKIFINFSCKMTANDDLHQFRIHQTSFVILPRAILYLLIVVKDI